MESLLHSSLSIADFSPEEQKATRSAYGSVFNRQMQIILAFALASFVISLFTFERNPRSLEEVHQSHHGQTQTQTQTHPRSKEEY